MVLLVHFFCSHIRSEYEMAMMLLQVAIVSMQIIVFNESATPCNEIKGL